MTPARLESVDSVLPWSVRIRIMFFRPQQAKCNFQVTRRRPASALPRRRRHTIHHRVALDDTQVPRWHVSVLDHCLTRTLCAVEVHTFSQPQRSLSGVAYQPGPASLEWDSWALRYSLTSQLPLAVLTSLRFSMVPYVTRFQTGIRLRAPTVPPMSVVLCVPTEPHGHLSSGPLLWQLGHPGGLGNETSGGARFIGTFPVAAASTDPAGSPKHASRNTIHLRGERVVQLRYLDQMRMCVCSRLALRCPRRALPCRAPASRHCLLQMLSGTAARPPVNRQCTWRGNFQYKTGLAGRRSGCWAATDPNMVLPTQTEVNIDRTFGVLFLAVGFSSM